MRTLLIFLCYILLFFPANAQDSKVFVFLNSKADKEKLTEDETAALMELHLANIEKMANEGKLLVAGPFDGGGGIFIFDTDNPSLTREWLQSDPAIRANRWNIEVFPVEFKKGGACLVGEPYEMVTYNFLRVNYINDIANYKMNVTSTGGWNAASQGDSVLAVGQFPQYDGGFIVYNGKEIGWQEEFAQDQVLFDLRKLWIAKGAFCE